MGVEAVVFDLDGTVVQHRIDIETGKKELVDVVKEEGLKLDPAKVSIYLMLKRAENLLSKERFTNFKKRIYDVISRYELKAAKETELVDGIVELISWLKAERIKLALLTNNSSEYLKIVDKRLGIVRYFDIITTRDDIHRIKPDPEGLIFTLERLGTKEAIMVGDSPSDVLVSRRAGIPSVGVISTSPHRELLILSGPDFLVNDVRLVRNVVEFLQR